MNKKNIIKDRLKTYLESIMFDPMDEDWFKDIAARTKRILIEEGYEFNDISVEYNITPAHDPAKQLIIFIKGKWDDIKVSVGYESKPKIGER